MQTKGTILIMKRYLLLVVFLVGAFLVSCGQEEPAPPSTPSQKIPTPKQKAVTEDVRKEPVEKKPEYVYDPAGRRDPFQPPFSGKRSIQLTGVPLTPLQKFEVSQLNLMGIIVGKGEPRALVVAPDGKSYILKAGTKVGPHDGTVVDINAKAVVVEEPYLDFSGEVRTGTKEIKVPEREGAE